MNQKIQKDRNTLQPKYAVKFAFKKKGKLHQNNKSAAQKHNKKNTISLYSDGANE